MKIIISTLFFLFIIISCVTQTKKEEIKDSLQNKKQAKIADGIKHITYADRDSLYAKIKITSKSIDTILASIDFINNSDSNVWLYKPILPFVELKGNYINFMDTKFNPVNFTNNSQYNFQYLFGNAGFSPAVRPDQIRDDNLLLLKPHQQIKFKLNIAKYYDFDSFMKNGINEFTYHFFILMPLIRNKIHVYQEDSYDNISKPAYLMIDSDDSPNNLKKFIIPKK